MDRIVDSFQHSLHLFLRYVPSIVGAVICFILTLIAARFFGRLGSRYTRRRTRDNLIANFLGKILWTIIFIAGTVISLGLLGLGNVSNKILAGAGITTFVIGFALKDIGENFLAGLILAFSRPYREGSLIECSGIKGIVRGMTMRQTTVEAENGQLILIPNSAIIKEPLTKFMDSDLDMRQEFSLKVSPNEIRKTIKIIEDTISRFDFVHKAEHKTVRVILDSLDGDQAKLRIVFWFDTARFEGSRSEHRSQVIMEVLDELKRSEIKFKG